MVTQADNISKTCKGTMFSYDLVEPYTTRYIAECIEHGEEFYSEFYTPQGYTPEQLYDIGEEQASIWGGECMIISEVLKDRGGILELSNITRP